MDMSQQLAEARREITKLRIKCATLKESVFEFNALINESKGVAGLHKNGDVADWSSLNGTWLLTFDEALSICDELEKQGRAQ